jgi:hypothetical protein
MLRRFGIALVLGLVAVPLQASDIERIETRYDDDVGFYENDGSRYRVTWRPTGGLYLIAIDPVRTSEPGGPTMFTVTEDESDRFIWDDRVVTIERDGGRTTSIVARDETGDPVRFTRLTPDPYEQVQVSWSNEDVRLVGTVMIPNGTGAASRCRADPGRWHLVPGEIVTVRARKQWRYAGHPYLSGDVESHRLNVKALGLVPLRLQDEGLWDPREE